MRKLVTLQRVLDVQPIPGADAIEVATILGWKIVVKKGEFHINDKVVYFEVDSMIPVNNHMFEFLAERGTTRMEIAENEYITGHRLRTIKLRGQISQGLAMPVVTFEPKTIEYLNTLSEGDEVKQLNDINDIEVVKYNRIMTDPNMIGLYDSRIAPTTGAVRIQSLVNDYDTIKTFTNLEASIKIDGESTTVYSPDGIDVKVYSHGAELGPESLRRLELQELGFIDEAKDNPGKAYQMEYVGPGIRGNTLKLPNRKFFIFSIVGKHHKFYSRDEWSEFALANATPLVQNFEFPDTIDELIELVATYRGHITKNILDEGIVVHVFDENLMSIQPTNNIKVLSNKWLLKYD